jgi:signal transduction histidine kinase
VNPANDSLRGFVPFLSNYSQNFLLAAEIPCRIDIPMNLPEAHLSSAQRHNLFLVVKEALHNIVKHAGATEVRLWVRTEEQRLEIHVDDNGCGIPEEVTSGDGTGNMQQRAASIGASLRRTSEAGKGTMIFLTLPLANLH